LASEPPAASGREASEAIQQRLSSGSGWRSSRESTSTPPLAQEQETDGQAGLVRRRSAEVTGPSRVEIRCGVFRVDTLPETTPTQ
jgi:hypothetical protein